VNRASFALLASLVVASVFARSEAPEVTFVSPCDCQNDATRVENRIKELRQHPGQGFTWADEAPQAPGQPVPRAVAFAGYFR
jgi:hypothetical protein